MRFYTWELIMSENDELLTNKYVEDVKESENSVFQGKKKRNIKAYIFNDLKKVEGEKNDNLLTEDEEKELFDKYIKTWNKAAFDKIIVSNLRFVIYMAKHFLACLQKQYNCRDIYLEDLIQAWNIWLIKAAQKYIPDNKWRFVTYAQHSIKYSMIHYIKYDNRFFWSILEWGVPVCKVKKMSEYIENFIQKNQREPQDEELLNFYSKDWSESFITNVQYYNNLVNGIISLDTNIKELSKKDDKLSHKIVWGMWDLFGSSDEETCLSDLLIDKDWEKWQPMDRESLIHDLNRVLNKLDEEQIKLIKMYYGLDWYKEYNLDELADYFRTTRERIRIKKEKILRILENDIQTELLRKYIK